MFEELIAEGKRRQARGEKPSAVGWLATYCLIGMLWAAAAVLIVLAIKVFSIVLSV